MHSQTPVARTLYQIEVSNSSQICIVEQLSVTYSRVRIPMRRIHSAKLRRIKILRVNLNLKNYITTRAQTHRNNQEELASPRNAWAWLIGNGFLEGGCGT